MDAESASELPGCATSVAGEFEIARIAPPAAGSDDYQPADGAARAAVADSLRALVHGDVAAALSSAAAADYELCGGTGDEAGIALWRPLTGGTGKALVAWRASQARPLIIGAPHAYFDLGTLQQAATAFFELGARALVASGTHRCASTAASSCDGTTTTCTGMSEPFRASDMAHVVDSVFQVAHLVLAEEYAQDWVLSLHGMSGAGISISDGTTLASAADQPVALIGAELMAQFPEESITSCNTWPGATVELRLCGTTNAQGRFVNGSPEPCAQSAATSAGRFVHLEQSATVRAAQSRVLQAIADALP